MANNPNTEALAADLLRSMYREKKGKYDLDFSQLASNDKTPSYDGSIGFKKDNEAGNIYISTQLKSTENPSNNKGMVTEQIKIKTLKDYAENDGVLLIKAYGDNKLYGDFFAPSDIKAKLIESENIATIGLKLKPIRKILKLEGLLRLAAISRGVKGISTFYGNSRESLKSAFKVLSGNNLFESAIGNEKMYIINHKNELVKTINDNNGLEISKKLHEFKSSVGKSEIKRDFKDGEQVIKCASTTVCKNWITLDASKDILLTDLIISKEFWVAAAVSANPNLFPGRIDVESIESKDEEIINTVRGLKSDYEAFDMINQIGAINIRARDLVKMAGSFGSLVKTLVHKVEIKKIKDENELIDGIYIRTVDITDGYIGVVDIIKDDRHQIYGFPEYLKINPSFINDLTAKKYFHFWTRWLRIDTNTVIDAIKLMVEKEEAAISSFQIWALNMFDKTDDKYFLEISKNILKIDQQNNPYASVNIALHLMREGKKIANELIVEMTRIYHTFDFPEEYDSKIIYGMFIGVVETDLKLVPKDLPIYRTLSLHNIQTYTENTINLNDVVTTTVKSGETTYIFIDDEKQEEVVKKKEFIDIKIEEE